MSTGAVQARNPTLMLVSRVAPHVVRARLSTFVVFNQIFWMPVCGNITTAGSTKAPESDCNTPCGGDKSEICGGNSRLSLYNNHDRPVQPDPTVVRDVGTWRLNGCYG